MEGEANSGLSFVNIFRVAIIAIVLVGWAFMSSVNAAELTSSSLGLSDPRPDETSTYTFNANGFTTATTIRCIRLVLNTQADGGGTAPTGLTTTSSTLDSSTVITAGSWTVGNGTNGTLEATNAAGETPNSSGDIVWGAVANGSTENTTYYGIFTTYTDAACTGGNEVDTSLVAFTYTDGELVSLIIGPELTFTAQAVASGSVNGATINTASTASGIDFGLITVSANGISAHDLEVATNATSGYVIYIRHSGALQTAGGGSNIDPHTGTNAAPASFPGPGTEAWGYTTEDASLSTGTPDRFTNPGNLWAGFNTSNEEVVYNSAAPVGTETTRVGQQVGIAGSTPAGTYQTTIIYTIVATY